MANTLKDAMKKYIETINRQLTEELSRRYYESFKKHPCTCINEYSVFNVIAVDPVTLDKEIVATFDNKRDAELWCYRNKWRFRDKVLEVVEEGSIPGTVLVLGYLKFLRKNGTITAAEYKKYIEDLLSIYDSENHHQ